MYADGMRHCIHQGACRQMPVLQSKNEYKETERKCKASCGKWEQRNECEKEKKVTVRSVSSVTDIIRGRNDREGCIHECEDWRCSCREEKKERKCAAEKREGYGAALTYGCIWQNLPERRSVLRLTGREGEGILAFRYMVRRDVYLSGLWTVTGCELTGTGGGRMEDYRTGGFTLPGEAGYEKLTLELARKWGADVIRDSDGTKLSPEIVEAGYRIYSTICIIREHNAFALAHPETQQQTFLCSDAVIAEGDTLTIDLLKGYFAEQFMLNESEASIAYWEVWDRTANALVPRENWSYAHGTITVKEARAYHRYTASFLCYRIWEEINMYNHTTNHWTTEHLRQLDPRNPLAWVYLKDYLMKWCEDNPQTNVIRLTSLFYNFVWIFGSDMRRRSRFVDWASYDFTVSPDALDAFHARYGYRLTAEDFIQGGKLQATHRPATRPKLDYMDMIQQFVAEKARELVDIIHSYHKEAYVFYDDSWVGMEPYGPYFASVGFDGLIKCVFSGFECRLCAGVDVPVHELRFHPYLFPVGLGGLPTFSEGGRPERDAMDYWLHVRRALARQSVDRIGLGGYLHLTQGYPDFVEAIADMGVVFRRLKVLHAQGAPEVLPIRVGVLHFWGRLRSWTLSGHFHETDMHTLIHINEALAGLPVEVSFLNFDDVRKGALDGVDVVITAGREGDAWCGGDAWQDPEIIEKLTAYVYEGGSIIGAGEPSACAGGDTRLKLAHVFGVDVDKGEYACHAPWAYTVSPCDFAIAEKDIPVTAGVRLTDPQTQVLLEKEGVPVLTMHSFGQGKAVYMGGMHYSAASARMLLEMLMMLTNTQGLSVAWPSDPRLESAYFAKSHTLVVMNNSRDSVETVIEGPFGETKISLPGERTVFVEVEHVPAE